MKVKVKYLKDASGVEKGTIKALPVNTAKAVVALGVAEMYKEEVKKKTSTKK